MTSSSMFIETDSSLLNLHSTHDDEREHIDAEIECLYARIRLLKNRRNQLAPISRLPAELLIRIFFLTQDLSLHLSKSYYEWLAVARVSAYWRNVALGTTALWGGIVQTVEEDWHHANLSLQRSGISDLDVLFHDVNNDPRHVGFITTLLAHMSRIRSLDIRLWAGWSNTFPGVESISKLLGQPAPYLESLVLSGASNRGVNFAEWSTPVFSGVAPRLHTLRLLRAQLDWETLPPFTNLVHLELQDSFDTRFSISHLLRLLNQTTELRTLQIDWSYPTTDSSNLPNQPVYLPKLSVLDLRMQGDEVLFLEHVRMPLTAVQTYWLKDVNQSVVEALRGCLVDSQCCSERLDVVEGTAMQPKDNSSQPRLDVVAFLVSPYLRLILPASVDRDSLMPLVSGLRQMYCMESSPS